MAITDIKKSNQYVQVTDGGKVRRYAVDFKDAIVSVILSTQYKVVNIYWDGSTFWGTYEDSDGTQTTVELGTGSAGLENFDGGAAASVYGGVDDSPVDGGAADSF